MDILTLKKAQKHTTMEILDTFPFVEEKIFEFKNPLTVTGGGELIAPAYEFDMTEYIGETVVISVSALLQKSNINFRNLLLYRWDSDGTIADFNPTSSVNLGTLTITSTDFGCDVIPFSHRFSYLVTKTKLFLVFSGVQKNPFSANAQLATHLELRIDDTPAVPSNKGIGKHYGNRVTADFFGRTSEHSLIAKPIDSDMLENNSVEARHLKNVVSVRGKNLFDKAKATVGAYINPVSGEVFIGSPNPSTYYASDWIEVEGGKTYVATIGAYAACYDADRLFIKGFAGKNLYVLPPEAVFFRTSVRDIYIDTFQFEEGEIASSYEPFSGYDKLENTKMDYFNIIGMPASTLNYWDGKTLNIIGDSVTYGLKPDKSGQVANPFVKIVAETLGMSLNNYGVSGSTIAINTSDPSERTPIVERYISMSDNADLVIVAAGTNDWQYDWSPLGDMTSRDNVTFYGALHNLCLGLLEKYPAKQVLFMTPIKRSQSPYASADAVNANGKTLKEYGGIIKEVCKQYSIPVLDMYSESLINPHLDTQRQLLVDDGTHPNQLGHEVIARRLAGYLKQLA